MSSRIRFATARNVFETFADLRRVAPPPDDEAAPLDYARRLLGSPRPARCDRLPRLSPAAPRGRLVGATMRRRDSGAARRRRRASRRRGLGPRAGRGKSARRAGNRQCGRSEPRHHLARARRRLVGRQHVRAGREADGGAGLGLRESGERRDRAGGLLGRSARHRAMDRRLRRGGHPLRRRRRGARDRAQVLRRQDAGVARRATGAKPRMMIVSLLSGESGGTRCRTTRL